MLAVSHHQTRKPTLDRVDGETRIGYDVLLRVGREKDGPPEPRIGRLNYDHFWGLLGFALSVNV